MEAFFRKGPFFFPPFCPFPLNESFCVNKFFFNRHKMVAAIFTAKAIITCYLHKYLFNVNSFFASVKLEYKLEYSTIFHIDECKSY